MEHKDLSHKFMKEYIELNHMSPVPHDEHVIKDGSVYYIPYHSILRKDAVTTKLRNVFNASAKSSTGISLNQTIYTGEKLQTKIFDIITRVRQFKFIYSSDITKMYRQIGLLPEDRVKIRILYRENAHQPISEYNLNTVTYGMDCAPWQAIRTIRQVAEDHAPSEEIKWIIKNSFYMDDLYHGADSISECQHQIQQVIKVLSKGKLPLTKWMSNHPEVLNEVEESKQLESYVNFKTDNSAIKTLGIQYYPKDDLFGFKVKPFTSKKFTKRSMMSMAASLYDPIGWILPVIMMFRILIQKLWYIEIKWDDAIEHNLKSKFESGIESLIHLQHFRIPRWMACSKNDVIQLVGFADASGDGIAAVVYSRIKKNGSYVITLIAAKGKVTPLKTKRNLDSKLCTIPKMELEALCLLTNLMKEVKSCFIDLKTTLTAYTDSQVALAWVRKSGDIENKFVKKRIQQIRKVLSPRAVNYVKSAENPADSASRGLFAIDFVTNQRLWLYGPDWMLAEDLPFTPFENVYLTHTTQIETPSNDLIIGLIEKYSTFSKLISVVAIMLLWLKIYTKKQTDKSAELYRDARRRVIWLQQQHSFYKEIQMITNGKPFPKGHWMSWLCPFLDSEGILRVGGRLDRAEISNNQKHPMLIPKCHLARLIIRDIHIKHGHSANLLTDSIVKQTYWIPGSRNIIRSEIRSCSVCLRFRAGSLQPQMSDLPIERIRPSPIFENTAVDFCGPFNIRPSRLKFEKVIKSWVAVFVCLSSKLVHLEICLELSADNFLAAFDRFTSRRSTPSQMLSDNGTNFVAANKILTEQFKSMVKKGASILATQEIKWNFIPPGSPHFGGLHESCVKSFKYFVKRMERVENLTYEEFGTLICKIEALLNSRPMYPLSTDVNDELALTPGHFAVQRSLKSPPHVINSTKTVGINKKWTLVQNLQNEFWRRFQTEYLSTQQKRIKWIQPQRNLSLDDIVILKDINSHPLDWPLGKIVKCYPDQKGTVRKVDVFTKNKNVVHRAVNKLIPIISEKEEQEIETKVYQTRQRSNNSSSFLTALGLNFMCMMCLFWPAETAMIKSLVPGIHIQPLGEVSIKTINMEFKLRTNINATNDVLIVNTEILRFQNFCNNILEQKYVSLVSLCKERYEFLNQEAIVTRDFIESFYQPSRQKRSWSFLTKLSLGGAIKAAPYVAMGAAASWQEYQNWQMQKNLEEVEQKFNKVSFILFNITETENDEIHQELDKLVDQQKQLIWEAEINSFVLAIESLISSLKFKHENVINLRPMEELHQYISKLNEESIIVKVPPLQSDEIFTIYPIKRYVSDDMVIIIFDIPLVRPETYLKYAIISVPYDEKETVILNNQKLVQVIVVNQDNSSYFYPENSVEIYPTIYEYAKMESTISCSFAILNNLKASDYCQFNIISNVSYIFYSLGKQYSVVFNREMNEISLQCPNKLQPIVPEFCFIDHPGCTIIGVDDPTLLEVTANETSMRMEFDFNFVPVKINQTKIVPNKEKLNNLKEDFYNSIKKKDVIIQHSLTAFGIATVFIILLCVFYVICRRNQGSTDLAELSQQMWTIPIQHRSSPNAGGSC